MRCVGGQLKRLGLKIASGGIASYPGVGDPSISARSAALGDGIAPGSQRFYQVYYRDSDPNFCPAPQGNTNWTGYPHHLQRRLYKDLPETTPATG